MRGDEAMRSGSKAVMAAVALAAASLAGCIGNVVAIDHLDGELGGVPLTIEVVSGEWQVQATDDGPAPPRALAQVAQSDGPEFNVCLLRDLEFTDGALSVSFRSVAGEVDQGGGVVWRAQDGRNYYVARFNPLEDNFRLYTVVDGKRTMLQSEKVSLEPGWHLLGIEASGGSIRCFLDGTKLLEAQDATFPGPGRVGLWTKADAQTHFDAFTVVTAPGSR
jgi:hypothetical protein